MASLTDLVNNIQGSIDGLIADFKGESGRVVSYYQGLTEFKNIQSQLNPGSWNKLVFPYTFAIVNLVNPQDTGGFSDFQLPLAPQSIDQDEPPAINIRPSQGGTTTNHNGMGIGTLVISGTTGVAPFRGEGGVNSKTGEAILQPKDLKHKSGYEVFIHLRNWFRTYYQWKKVFGKAAKNHRLIFKNYKDGEFLIVELENFKMKRQAARSFLYDYELTFKILSHFQFSNPASKTGFLADTDSFIENALNKINTARGIFLRSQGILRQIEATYDSTVLEPMRQTILAIKALKGIPLVASDIASRTIANTVSTANALRIQTGIDDFYKRNVESGTAQIKSQINNLLDKGTFGAKNTLQKTLESTASEISHKGSIGLLKLGGLMTMVDSGNFPEKTIQDTIEEQSNALNLPRNFYEQAIESIVRVKQNAEDFFNLGSEEYDTLFNRTTTLKSDFTKVTTNDEYDMLYAFNEALTGLNLLLSTNDLFKSDYDDRVEDMNSRFNGNIQLLSNSAVKQIQIQKGITLEKLAQVELGDSTRWGEIAEVNNLKAPYLSEDPLESRDGVLGPGDNILIPISVRSGFSEVPSTKDNKLTIGMSAIEKSLGVDLKIDGNFDLMLTSSGDLELVAGSSNMAQATILHLAYEPGEVMLYPEMGAGLQVGRKFPPVEDLKDRVTNSLLQDARVSKVSDLALLRQGPALYLSFNLFVKNVDIAIPVKIKI